MHSASPTPVVKNERLFLLTIAGIQFTHILDFMIMMPLGPQLIRVLHIDTHQFGVLLSSYTFTAAASGLLAASYIDRFDRRKLILTLYALFIIATLCCGLAPDYTTLLIARALAGAFGGILGAMVQTMVADVIPFERRGKAMGTVMTAFSISTVAGVPLGLLLASSFPAIGWRAPFFFIVLLAAGFWLIGYKLLPSLTAHLHSKRVGNIFQQIFTVAKEPSHLTAFAFIALLMMAGFTVIPYIALYMTTNVGLPESFITVIYLCGGAATFFTSQLIGRMSDKHGKLKIFRRVALASFIPLLITTHLVPIAWWLVLINSTLFFILVPGRMVPGMAMVSAVPVPHVRGTFMSLASSVQMLSSGLATLVAGLIMTRAPDGQIVHYDTVGYLAVACGIASIWIARHLRIATPAAATGKPLT
ncbi:Putative permease of the major facilitator superfamily [Herminiimonas arsenicoxydans]|uniref:Permease of the major facilitator superfamily n=1 Tax=Herminiimonas arsenicoxydans TaxID=204773 RepID=A4G960_HERAR|nr:Putative permease of the major facilitator superfamily [Herminiimonas arsenicoxydans]